MPKAIEKALSDLCNEHALIGLSVEYSAICSVDRDEALKILVQRNAAGMVRRRTLTIRL